METNEKIRKKVENLARELDIKITDIKEMLDVTDDIPHQCGVYIITTIMSDKKYIGSTKDMRRRIQSHKLRPYIRIIDVYLIENIEDAQIMEDLLIGSIRPELNKLIPSIDPVMQRCHNVIQRCRNVVKVNREHMTAVQISENIHLLITKKRIEIIEKYGKRFNMKDIADVAIEEGIGKVEEKLGLSNNVQK